MTQRRFSFIIIIRSKVANERAAASSPRALTAVRGQAENRQMITSFKLLPSVVLAALARIVWRDYPNR
jgi:hypothetical protein